MSRSLGLSNLAKGLDSSGELNDPSLITSVLAGDISTGNITTTGYVRGPSTFVIDPATHGDSTGTLRILGGLTVEGTTTTINSTTVTVDDKNVVLAEGAIDSAASDGAGITVNGSGASILYDHTNSSWDFNRNIEVDGSFGATSITETSSIRYKENIRNLEASQLLSQLRPVIYDRKDGSSRDEAGFIAEEVNEISPNLVTKDKGGLVDGVHYTRIIPYLVAKIQELEETVRELKDG